MGQRNVPMPTCLTGANDMTDNAELLPCLLPCPFCGGKANGEGVTRYSRPLDGSNWADGSGVTEVYFVNCMGCGLKNGGIFGGFQTRDKAIAAWNTRATAPCPEGWRLVPVEPTPEMVQAACDATFGPAALTHEQAHITGWSAMLSAAPVPASPPMAEGVQSDKISPVGAHKSAEREAAALSTRPRVSREEVAQIVARAYGGSLYPGLGTPGDYPTDDPDYRAADAILALFGGGE